MYWNSRKRPTSSGVCIYALSKIAWECWIYITYPSVHTLVFGGDFNEDLGIPEDSERKHRLKGLLQHCKLTTRETEGTIHVDSYWTEVLQSRDTLYPGLRYLYSNHYKPGVKPIAIHVPVNSRMYHAYIQKSSYWLEPIFFKSTECHSTRIRSVLSVCSVRKKTRQLNTLFCNVNPLSKSEWYSETLWPSRCRVQQKCPATDARLFDNNNENRCSGYWCQTDRGTN